VLRLNGNCVRGINFNGLGNPYDADALTYPHVQYAIDFPFGMDPLCLVDPNTVVNFNSGAPIMDSRMYNQYINNGSPLQSFEWNYGDDTTNFNAYNPSHLYGIPTPYTVVLNKTMLQWDGSICQATQVQTIELRPEQDFRFVNTNLDVQFTNESDTGWDQISWNFGDGTPLEKGEKTTHTFGQPGRYLVSLAVTDAQGKTATEYVTVEVFEPLEEEKPVSVLELPNNVLSPNGDGINDVFRVRTENVKSFHLIIFNRGGEIILDTHDPNATWDGHEKGVQAQSGTTYFYQVTALGEDGVIHQYKEYISVYR